MPTTKIKEIPIDKLDILIDKMGQILEQTKQEKSFLFDTKDIIVFINNSVKYIIKDIQMLK